MYTVDWKQLGGLPHTTSTSATKAQNPLPQTELAKYICAVITFPVSSLIFGSHNNLACGKNAN